MPVPETQRLLKARTVHGLGSKVAYNYDDLHKQCDDYIAGVKQHGEQLLAQAQAQADQLRRQAFDEGQAAGEQAGLQRATQLIETRASELANERTSQQLRTTLPAVEAAVSALQIERDRWLAWWESAAVRLSVAIAEKIIRHELAQRPEFIPQMISEALQLAAGSPNIKIRLNPRDIGQLRECSHEILQKVAPLGESALTPDDKIAPGGCLIETAHGVIDARLETQLARITAELLEGNA